MTGSSNTVAGAASATGSSVVGSSNTVNATNAMVMGNNSTVTGTSAIGNNVTVAGADAIAIGTGTSANFANSAAIGTGATATRANQQAFGTSSNTYTMPGIASTASKAAQSGGLSVVSSDSAGNLASHSLSELGIASTADLNSVRTEERRGLAAAMAMTTAAMPSAAGRVSWAINAAAFLGHAAGGASLAYRLDTNVPVALTAGYSYGGGNAHGVRVGLQGEF